MLSEPHKLFKLIWQKKKCCDYKCEAIYKVHDQSGYKFWDNGCSIL